MLVYFGPANAIARAAWSDVIGAERLLFLPVEELGAESRLGDDPHWSATGHARVAEHLLGLIADANWLPGLGLAPAPRAIADAREIFERGRQQAATPLRDPDWDAVFSTEIRPASMTGSMAQQVYGGLEADGLVSPYLSLILRDAPSADLRITGRALPHGVLAGTAVRVSADGTTLGRFVLTPGARIDERFPLPAERGELIHVELEADDFVYTDDKLRKCLSWRLERIAVER